MEKIPVSLTDEYSLVRLKSDTVGVYYCLDCEKVVGQIPSRNDLRLLARQDAAVYVNQTGHRVEEVFSEIETTRFPRIIRSLSTNFNLSNMSFIFKEK